MLRTSLNENQISAIKEKDKTLSIILDIVIILLTPVIFVAANGGGLVPDSIFI